MRFVILKMEINSTTEFNVHGSVHRKSILIYIQQDAKLHSLFYLEAALHVSGGSTTHHQERIQLYLQHLVFVTPLSRQLAVTVWQIPDAVDTVVCAPDDGWWYHPKHVEQFPDKITCVTLHLVGYILEYSYDARTHELLSSHIIHHTLSYVYHWMFCGDLMWAYTFGRVAVEPSRPLAMEMESASGTVVCLNHLTQLSRQEDLIGKPFILLSTDTFIDNFTISFRPLLCMRNVCAQAGCGYLQRFT